MFSHKVKNIEEINNFLIKTIYNQYDYELSINKKTKQKKGVFFTNSLETVETIIDIIKIEEDILQKKILEPSCGQGIFILKLLTNIYRKFPDKKIIHNFIANNIYFIDIQKEMIEATEANIKNIYLFLFEEKYNDKFNSFVWDFTDKSANTYELFNNSNNNPFINLYGTFDYVIGNPPYVTLYGRRDKKDSEEQRVKYLKNYKQFPDSLKNGKLNLVMLFIEHSIELLNLRGILSFIIDISFFETAYKFTRKYLLENTTINQLQVNIKEFNVASGQVILKVSKGKSTNNKVHIIDHKTNKSYLIDQSEWENKDDEFKFRFNGCYISKKILEKVISKKDKSLKELFPKKSLRTCVMLLDMEDKFTSPEYKNSEFDHLIYPYYQGSKALSNKYGSLKYEKFFFYNKHLQDCINDKLKIKLQKEGIKNKKRIGLGETIIYNNPKIYIRQSAKEIIATIDLKKSAANNSLYVFSLRDSSEETIDMLYFLCGFLNSQFITYYAQQMNIIRFSQGKQPQIKISDLNTIYIPGNIQMQRKISHLTKNIYKDPKTKESSIKEIDNLIYNYYNITLDEIKKINSSIKDF